MCVRLLLRSLKLSSCRFEGSSLRHNNCKGWLRALGSSEDTFMVVLRNASDDSCSEERRGEIGLVALKLCVVQMV